MRKGSFSNEEVMEEYLTNLLTEEQPVVLDQVRQQSVARLLEESVVSRIPEQEVIAEVVPEPVAHIEPEPEPPAQVPPQKVAPEEKAFEETFQALFFEVAGLSLAVPLTELGGIHNLDKVGHVIGKPDWFKGVMLHRDEKLNVVDTARWVMPEKYDEKLAESLNYQYLIMLDTSPWGLACDTLINTVTLTSDSVKWRSANGKRPWLAGMVKDKMCALVDVHQLISMLDQGLGSND